MIQRPFWERTLTHAQHNTGDDQNGDAHVLVRDQGGQDGCPKGQQAPESSSYGQDNIASDAVTQIASQELRQRVPPEKTWQHSTLWNTQHKTCSSNW